MLLLTAYTEDFGPIGDLCWASMQRYQLSHPRVRIARHIIPRSDRHPSWDKVELIMEHLKRHDYVTWLDADAMVIGQQDLCKVVQPATLNIAKDGHGINCGVMCWRSCPESYRVLSGMAAAYEAYKDHPWFEQAALADFIGGVNVHYQPQEVWNCYPLMDMHGNPQVTDVSMALFIHYPGTDNATRLESMARFSQLSD